MGSQVARKKVKRHLTVLSAFMVAGSLLAGCSNSGTATEPKPADSKPGTTAAPAPKQTAADDKINDGNPITITMFQWAAALSDTEFKNLIADPVHQKWPNVTMQMVRSAANATADKLVAANNFPDMSFIASVSLTPLLDLGILEDMTPYVKKYNLDMNQYVQHEVNSIKGYADKGQLYGLPFVLNFGVLYYNKSIFDKYAVPYPKDGNTFDDLIELSKQISAKRTDDSLQPLGINDKFPRLAVSLGIPAYDPKTKKAVLQTDDWRNALQMYVNMMKVPGNYTTTNTEIKGFQAGKVAMYTSYGARIGEFEEMLNKGQDLDWDMATFPVMKGAKNSGMELTSGVLSVSSTSKHKDDAFKIIKFLTTDHAVQEKASRSARMSALNDPSLEKVFGADLKTMKGKNLNAIFQKKYVDLPVQSAEENAARNALGPESRNVVEGKEDINTALRIAEDKANSQIQLLLKK